MGGATLRVINRSRATPRITISEDGTSTTQPVENLVRVQLNNTLSCVAQIYTANEACTLFSPSVRVSAYPTDDTTGTEQDSLPPQDFHWVVAYVPQSKASEADLTAELVGNLLEPTVTGGGECLDGQAYYEPTEYNVFGEPAMVYWDRETSNPMRYDKMLVSSKRIEMKRGDAIYLVLRKSNVPLTIIEEGEPTAAIPLHFTALFKARCLG